MPSAACLHKQGRLYPEPDSEACFRLPVCPLPVSLLHIIDKLILMCETLSSRCQRYATPVAVSLQHHTSGLEDGSPDERLAVHVAMARYSLVVSSAVAFRARVTSMRALRYLRISIFACPQLCSVPL